MSYLTNFFDSQSKTIGGANVTSNVAFVPKYICSNFGIITTGVYNINEPTIFAHLSAWGVAVPIVGGAGYEVILDEIGPVILSSFISPAVAAAGEAIDVRITVDGDEFIRSYPSENARSRLYFGAVDWQGTGYNGAIVSWVSGWAEEGLTYRFSNEALQLARLTDHGYPIYPILYPPNKNLALVTCLLAAKSLKIEVSTPTAIVDTQDQQAVYSLGEV